MYDIPIIFTFFSQMPLHSLLLFMFKFIYILVTQLVNIIWLYGLVTGTHRFFWRKSLPTRRPMVAGDSRSVHLVFGTTFQFRSGNHPALVSLSDNSKLTFSIKVFNRVYWTSSVLVLWTGTWILVNFYCV